MGRLEWHQASKSPLVPVCSHTFCYTFSSSSGWMALLITKVPDLARDACLWSHRDGSCTLEIASKIFFNVYSFAVSFWRLDVLGPSDFPVNSDLFTHGRISIGIIIDSLSDLMTSFFQIFISQASFTCCRRVNPYNKFSIHIILHIWLLP